MVSIVENMARTRDLLDNPIPQRPSFHQNLRQQFSELQDLTNALNNTGLIWGEYTYQLNYTPNQSDYEINVSDFGKCVFATRQTQNPFIPEVAIQIGDRNKQHYGSVWQYYYGAYGQWIPWSESPEQLIFWRSGAQNPAQMVTVMPQPQSAQVYFIHYIPGFLSNDVALTTAVQMPEHQELMRLRAAAALLPYTDWGDDENLNQRKRDMLVKSFEFQLSRKEDLLKNYITSINAPKSVNLVDWNSW